MFDFEILLKDIKNPRHIALSAVVCFSCILLGYIRGSIAGLIVGLIMGIILSFWGLIFVHKHEERQKEILDSLVIPKIGLTEKKEQWLLKKKIREVNAEKRADIAIKIIWWTIFAFIGLSILYWISPIIYYTLQI